MVRTKTDSLKSSLLVKPSLSIKLRKRDDILKIREDREKEFQKKEAEKQKEKDARFSPWKKEKERENENKAGEKQGTGKEKNDALSKDVKYKKLSGKKRPKFFDTSHIYDDIDGVGEREGMSVQDDSGDPQTSKT